MKTKRGYKERDAKNMLVCVK